MTTALDNKPATVHEPLRPYGSILRVEHVLARHNDSVLSLVVSRRTNRLFSGDQDGLIIVWELNTFSFECELYGHRRPITSMIVSDNAINGFYMLISASRDNTIRIWNSVSMQLLNVLENMGCCAFDLALDRSQMFAGCLDTHVMTVDLASLPIAVANETAVDAQRFCKFFTHHLGFIYSLTVVKDLLFTGSGDFTIGVWNCRTMEYLKTMVGHTDSVTSLAVIPDQYLISGSRDNSIKLWGLDSWHLVRSVDLGAAIIATCIADSALFVSTSDNAIQALDLQTFRPIGHGKISSSWTTLFICRDRQFLFSCGTDSAITVWRNEDPTGVAFFNPATKPRTPICGILRATPVVSCSATFSELLAGAGAERYADLFAKHEIDLEALLLLNDQDLEQVGIPLGTRRKIVAMIDRLSHNTQRNTNDNDLIHFLQLLVGMETVSSDPSKRTEAWNCARFIEQCLLEMGAETRLRQVNPDSNPILIAKLSSFSNDPIRPKVVFYAHYDVFPVVESQWSVPPFTLSGRNGYLYGRGASDNKGPLAAFIYAVKELISEDGGLPSDVVMIFDGEGETDSFKGGFCIAVQSAMEWLANPTVVVLANTVWSGQVRPCLNYGTRGIVSMTLEIGGLSQDLHSGVHGGAFHEPLTDAIHVLSTLIDRDGNVLIDGFYDGVDEISPLEESYYAETDFDIDAYREETGIGKLRFNDVTSILQCRWRRPTLSIHSVENLHKNREQSGSIISSSVKASVSMRTTPNQKSSQIAKLFTAHVTKEFNRLESSNTLSVKTAREADWWIGDPECAGFKAAVAAIAEVWGVSPLFIREGGTLATIRFLEDVLAAPAVHFAFGQASDQSHLEDERIRIKNLLNGRDVFKAFIRKIGSESKSNLGVAGSSTRTPGDPHCLPLRLPSDTTFSNNLPTDSAAE
uniref:SAM domain-containing protein n=1 Tax=Spongospora subterranea TaxID=70186 RepID=A0A0H5R413_9EUKA|eukprot:CRZ02764.1 hypothetical protein [Spongospora subterranea]